VEEHKFPREITISFIIVGLLAAFFFGYYVNKYNRVSHPTGLSDKFPQFTDYVFYVNGSSNSARNLNGSIVSNGTDLGLVFQQAYNLHPYGTSLIFALIHAYTNLWDNGYPSGGNYWSDYHGNDDNHDGIGDSPYANNVDHYPLISPWTPTLSVQNIQTWYWTSNTAVNSIAAEDIDNNGQKETITAGTFFDGTHTVAQLVIWNSPNLVAKADKEWLWGQNTSINCTAIGDVDGDVAKEIVTGGSYQNGASTVGQLIVWNANTLVAKNDNEWLWGTNTQVTCVAINYIDNDGAIVIVTGGHIIMRSRQFEQLIIWNGKTLVADNDKECLWGTNSLLNSLSLNDIDNDVSAEIVVGAAYFDGLRWVSQLTI
jgi:hypothetical protein